MRDQDPLPDPDRLMHISLAHTKSHMYVTISFLYKPSRLRSPKQNLDVESMRCVNVY